MEEGRSQLLGHSPVLICRVAGASKFIFVIGSQVTLLLLVWSSQFENCYSSSYSSSSIHFSECLLKCGTGKRCSR